MAGISDIISSVSNFVNPQQPGPKTTSSTDDQDSLDLKLNGQPNSGDNLYSVIKANWYTALPYGFTFNPRPGGPFSNPITMFLPISPSNLSIQTQFATNIITTLYGTVEEHSEVRYWDITISGTTGYSPKYVYPVGSMVQATPGTGRSSFSIAGTVPLGGFLSKTLAMFSQITNTATSLLGSAPAVKTGMYIDQSGYLAFHNLSRFLLIYKNDAAGQSSTAARTEHPLQFFNYKDNIQWDVAVRGFSMTKDAGDPHLYNYSITLRGYNQRSAGASSAPEDITTRLAALGLNGVQSSSLLGTIKQKSDQAKNIIGSALGGINVLGR